jgi:predicted nuclease with TOPRIM domain
MEDVKMAKITKTTKDDDFTKSLKAYISLKQEIKELEDSAKIMEKEIFSTKNLKKLPESIEVEGANFVKQTREPVIPITIKMLEDAGLDEERIIPLATFSKTLVKTVYGESGKTSVEETDSYNDERALKSVSIFYKKK